MKVQHCLPVLAIAAMMTASAAPAQAAGEAYVALGDSYAAGVGIPTVIDPACDRSDKNYAHLVAARQGYLLTDVTCGGATTSDVAAVQMSAVGANTEIVTLGISGNDIGFGDIVRSCVILTGGAGCRDKYPDMPERIAKAGTAVGNLLDTVRERAPKARILLVGYPKIVPDNEASCTGVQPFAAEDLAWARDTVIEGLNAMLAGHAGDRVTYVDTEAATTGHDMCQPAAQRWINGAQVVAGSDGRTIHPNSLGHQAMAGQVLARLGSGPGLPTGSFGG
ncbi:SGNH/GDSL hydrolase family protein [Nocardia goodfellowii]|uniref:Lysophospholipase L1-like esterase n=1 Tax=Nocardia goodfellowii TaxID=882446 RepID=A0ABS4QRP3_9NOCA|nr:SGNH/GDSL hydrolase family protein [Nocardia goodfellowii]MBP2194365.1 lysophospholipase L1-like esterase [Nocardia goodfellowii]